jgi:peptidoglycan/LPS O-acetylase OafA/YrhL
MSRERTLPYLPGLDGLRALAVMAVVLYHAGQVWIPGGFLGVEVFFVISGYIITSGLLAERRQTGSIRPPAFWQRRALRLLPALFAMLAALLVYVTLFDTDRLGEVRADTLAAALYITNWKLIFHHVPYFESFGPPPLLQHLWSLAVEEQFYIVWPLVLIALLRLLRPPGAAIAIMVAALGSAALTAYLFSGDVFATSRVYYGTDTRGCGLLLGAALAFVVRPGEGRGLAGAIATTVAGLGGLAGLTAITLTLGQYESLLYRGGFLLTDVLTAAAIVGVTQDRAPLGRVIGFRPLPWIGVRSYGIYLWHWPVVQLFAPRTGSDLVDTVLQIAVVLGLAATSYALVEAPARAGGLLRLLRSLTFPATSWSYRRSFGTMGAGIAIAAAVVTVTTARAPSVGASLSTAVQAQLLFDMTTGAQIGAEREQTLPSLLPTPTPEPEPTPEAPAPPPPPPPPPPLPVVGVVPIPAGLKIVAIGDSVMLGASRQMVYLMGSMDIDAEVGLQVSTAVELLRAHIAQDGTPDIVIIGLGTNGGFSARQFDQIMEQLANVRLVVFVNVRVPRPWEGPNNRVIAEGVAYYPNTVLVDWYSATADHPEVFGNDGVHLTGTGIRLFAGMVADAIVKNWK